MNQIIDNFHKVLNKYKFVHPVSTDKQDLAISSSKKNLKPILKKTGKYSLRFSILFSIFFWLRNIGLNVTFFQTKVIITIATLSLSVSTTTGGYYVVKNIIMDEPVKGEIKIDNEKSLIKPGTNELDIKLNKKIIKSPFNKTKSPIGIQYFSGTDAESTRLVTTKIRNELAMALGKNTIPIINIQKSESADKIVMGSVRLLEKKWVITVKVINTKNHRIEYSTSESVLSKDSLTEACDKISKKIVNKLKE